MCNAWGSIALPSGHSLSMHRSKPLPTRRFSLPQCPSGWAQVRLLLQLFPSDARALSSLWLMFSFQYLPSIFHSLPQPQSPPSMTSTIFSCRSHSWALEARVPFVDTNICVETQEKTLEFLWSSLALTILSFRSTHSPQLRVIHIVNIHEVADGLNWKGRDLRPQMFEVSGAPGVYYMTLK